MTHIHVTDTIEYSPERAGPVLEEYMDRRRGSSGEIAVSLRLDLAAFGLRGDLAIKHDVLMRFVPAEPKDCSISYDVEWTPAPAGPYPRFSGTMRLLPAADSRRSVLELSGAYEPPLGMLGAAFDAMLGHRIAAATLRAFAHDLASQISPDTSSASRR